MILTETSRDRRRCTYHREDGVADAEARLGGEVLIRDEADPDLTAFRTTLPSHNTGKHEASEAYGQTLRTPLALPRLTRTDLGHLSDAVQEFGLFIIYTCTPNLSSKASWILMLSVATSLQTNAVFRGPRFLLIKMNPER
ncbi:hypothetical protein EYF80_018984 [Liparis tanakae]|uniref:Uncharacterized protein n=1 Tax=Liparis tanakae TaxID=230148 RepID=A0A4Z2HZ86_9TELE|nr:hypothetical protein EYF80_018984 [Liparis tanakae]